MRAAATAVGRTAALMAETKVRLWTVGDANWRPKGERRALEKVRDAMII